MFLGGKWQEGPFLTAKIENGFLEEVDLALNLIGSGCAESR